MEMRILRRIPLFADRKLHVSLSPPAFLRQCERECESGGKEGRGGEPLIFQTPSFAGGTMDLGEKGRGVWDREEEGGHLRKHSRIDLGPRRKISPRYQRGEDRRGGK